MSNAQLSLALRALGGDIATEAAHRLARTAVLEDGADAVMVNLRRFEIPRRAPTMVTIGDSFLPAAIERVVVDHLKPGEYRAVDVFGEIMIVHRPVVR